MIGNLFFNEIKRNGYLPTKQPSDLDEKTADSLIFEYYNFTRFDSTVADFRIKILKNDWPYINPKNHIPRSKLISLDNLIDSLALEVIDGRISREQARLKVANNYLRKKELDKYSNEDGCFDRRISISL